MKERIKNEQVVQAKESLNEDAIEQVIGREGETATLLSKLSVTFYVDAGGFAPRHLSRWLSRGGINARCF